MKDVYRKTLIGLAHDLSPIVTVASKGVTENILTEIEVGLAAHELIKIKLNGEREEREAWTAAILEHLPKAELIQKIGKIIVIFQPNPKKKKK